jgi:hypothetical protein
MPLIVSSLPQLPQAVPRFSLLLHVVVPYHTKVVHLGSMVIPVGYNKVDLSYTEATVPVVHRGCRYLLAVIR